MLLPLNHPNDPHDIPDSDTVILAFAQKEAQELPSGND
jgi:hypothetical protein